MKTESLMIRDFPVDERPRERLINNGPESLSNQELLAILLRQAQNLSRLFNWQIGC